MMCPTNASRADGCNTNRGAFSCAGDDDGRIQLWDMRQAEEAGSFAAHTDYISDMAARAPECALRATSSNRRLNHISTYKVVMS
jgi:hypothetical protein